MVAVAQTAPGAVLESNFAAYSVPLLKTLPGTFFEIRCLCPRELALARYRDRAAHRHAGHLDDLRDEEELWNNELVTPLGVGPVIEVDTSSPVDVDALAQQVRRRAASR
jgi:hypothetical protein